MKRRTEEVGKTDTLKQGHYLGRPRSNSSGPAFVAIDPGVTTVATHETVATHTTVTTVATVATVATHATVSTVGTVATVGSRATVTTVETVATHTTVATNSTVAARTTVSTRATVTTHATVATHATLTSTRILQPISGPASVLPHRRPFYPPDPERTLKSQTSSEANEVVFSEKPVTIPSLAPGPSKAADHTVTLPVKTKYCPPVHKTTRKISGTITIPSYAPGPSKAPDHTETVPVNVQYCTSYSGNISGSRVSTAVKVHGCLSTSSPGSNPIVSSVVSSSAQQHQNFQRLKVEDALSYLDQVKYKFGTRPQVYNDFLDIMKEFKSQSIDTPGVIQRVSNLFKGHPELIVGFNTFLPPGYKIEVQPSDQTHVCHYGVLQGHSFQVSVSMPSPSSVTAAPPHMTAGMVAHHLAIPASLSSPMGPSQIPATASHSAPATAGIAKPLRSPTLSAPAAYHTVATSVPVIEPDPSSPPVVYHQDLPDSSPPLLGPSGYSSPSPSITHTDPSTSQVQGQPVEFNHAINYVNKIKNRFQNQPEKYKRFLEILHTYQKEQRSMKEGLLPPAKYLTEAEVYAQVSKLFEHQDDLLNEFGQFLPDATCHQATLATRMSYSDQTLTTRRPSVSKQQHSSSSYSGRDTSEQRAGTSKFGHSSGHHKRSSSAGSSGHGKKHKIPTLRDIPMTEATKYTTLSDFAFFEKVRKALKTQEAYENFLRTLSLYNNQVVSSAELMQLITPFLGKFPELFRWFKHFMRQVKGPNQQPSSSNQNVPETSKNGGNNEEIIESSEEIEFKICEALGASYCALPKNYKQPKCSGRTPLCDEVLNDTCVSHPSWAVDSTFVTAKKTQFEDYLFKCEDERYELDMVIESNIATIQILEKLKTRISRMSPDEAASFRLDDCLGGTSAVIHQLAIRRVYGDKALDIIEGLKRNPAVSVPVVLKRLKTKEEEWRDAQKGFNRVWSEQNEKYYLKSLDHQAGAFKSSDLKALRSKSLFGDIEQIEQGERGKIIRRPRITLLYKNKNVLEDISSLLIHYVRRQTSIQKDDKLRVKILLRHYIPDMLFHPRQEISDDEREEEDKTNANQEETSHPTEQSEKQRTGGADYKDLPEAKRSAGIVPSHATGCLLDETYALFYTNSTWYLFMRLHQILCERVATIYEKSMELVKEENYYKKFRRESTTLALRLKPKCFFDVEKYYPTFIDMLKGVLDGSLDTNTFEDQMRGMYGIHAYIAFTLDKIINYAVRQLHNLVTDQTCRGCLDLFREEWKRGGAGGDCEDADLRFSAELEYLRRAENLISPDNIYKIVIFKQESQMTLELLNPNERSRLETELEKKLAEFGEGCSSSDFDIVHVIEGSQSSATVSVTETRSQDVEQLDIATEDHDEVVVT